MSKKDFVLIAGVLATTEMPKTQRHRLALQFATKLAETNRLFDVDRFMAAATKEGK